MEINVEQSMFSNQQKTCSSAIRPPCLSPTWSVRANGEAGMLNIYTSTPILLLVQSHSLRDGSDGITFSVLIFLHGRIPRPIDVLNRDVSLATDTAISAVGGCNVTLKCGNHTNLPPTFSIHFHIYS